MATESAAEKTGPGAPPPLRAVFLRLGVRALLLALALFVPAGTLNWSAGWIYFLLYCAWSFGNARLLHSRSPGLLARRVISFQVSSEPWDKAFIFISAPLFACMLLICGAEGPSCDWGAPGVASECAAFLGVAAAYALGTLALLSNPFAVGVVQVREGQSAADSGPYAVIRHPMYLAAICFSFCTPAALGSVSAFVPAVLLAAAIFCRTVLEDRFLTRQLPGYGAYAARVRYRLVPGVW